MSSCKKVCLHPDCFSNIYYYANYSRFHGFCQVHYPPTEHVFNCKICGNQIVYNMTIPLPIKADYKNSLRPPPEKNESETIIEVQNSSIPSDPDPVEPIQESINPSNTGVTQISSKLKNIEDPPERKQTVLFSVFNKKESYQTNEENNFFCNTIKGSENYKENCTFLEYLKKKTKSYDEKQEDKAEDDGNNISESEKIVRLQLSGYEKIVEGLEKISYNALEKSIRETDKLAFCYNKLKDARENDKRIIKSELGKIEIALNSAINFPNLQQIIGNILSLLDRDIYKSVEDSSKGFSQC